MNPMIKDTIANSAKYEELHPRFKAAFEFLRNTDLNALAPGRHVIDGDNVYVNVPDPAKLKLATWTDDALLEAHRAYIDIQVPLAEDEVIGYIYDEAGVKANDAKFDTAGDCVLYTNPKMEKVTVKVGEFIVFVPPYAAHAPCKTLGAPVAQRKLIVKVKMA